MNNIFLFDIDGTLSKNGIIPTSAKKTLEILSKNNIVMLSTGRTRGQFNDELKNLPVRGAILNNGGLAILDNEIIYESQISYEVINQMRNDGLHLGYLSMDCYFTVDDHKSYHDFADYFHIEMPKLMSEEYLYANKSYSLGVYGYDLDNLDISKYPLKFIRIAPLGFDVINLGVSKAKPIERLKELFPDKKIIAFGDNYNDVEMLEAADIRVVMESAPSSVKSIADFIAEDPLSDGIYKMVFNNLEEYI